MASERDTDKPEIDVWILTFVRKAVKQKWWEKGAGGINTDFVISFTIGLCHLDKTAAQVIDQDTGYWNKKPFAAFEAIGLL